MPKIKCIWVACVYNSNKCNGEDIHSFGECICQEEIVLGDSLLCGECNCETNGLSCESFEFKPQFIKSV